MKKLFEYAILLQEEEDENGKVTDPAKILVEPTFVLAEDIAQVNILASRAIPEENIATIERVTLVVRPF